MAGAIIWLVIMIAIIASSVSKSKKAAQRQGHPLDHGNLPPNKDPFPEIIPSRPTAKPNRVNAEKQREEAAMEKRRRMQQQTNSDSSIKREERMERAVQQQKNSRYEHSKPVRNNSMASKAMRDYNTRNARKALEEQNARQQAAKEDSILSRANQNVKEDFQDENEMLATNSIYEKAHASQKKKKKVEAPIEQKENLLKEVNDLMIVGPDVSIRFERDFVAEGLDMINRSLGSI